jgi:predicted transcriptional regulator YheO
MILLLDNYKLPNKLINTYLDNNEFEPIENNLFGYIVGKYLNDNENNCNNHALKIIQKLNDKGLLTINTKNDQPE